MADGFHFCLLQNNVDKNYRLAVEQKSCVSEIRDIRVHSGKPGPNKMLKDIDKQILSWGFETHF